MSGTAAHTSYAAVAPTGGVVVQQQTSAARATPYAIVSISFDLQFTLLRFTCFITL